jgi:hypothetical protein
MILNLEWWVRIMQRAHIINTPEGHRRYHIGFLSDYCLISGHWNYVLDGLCIWRKLEYLVSKVGINPRAIR